MIGWMRKRLSSRSYKDKEAMILISKSVRSCGMCIESGRKYWKLSVVLIWGNCRPSRVLGSIWERANRLLSVVLF